MLAEFESLNEPASVAAIWRQIGRFYEDTGQLELAETAFRQGADISFQFGRLRLEGVQRSNIAGQLVKLNRLDEARREIGRAIECNEPFGHVGEPWNTFDILSDLERAVVKQNPDAARAALEDPETDYAAAAEITLALET